MAAEQLPDFAELAVELVQLRHRQGDLLRQYDKALERIAAFPNEMGRTRAAALGKALDEISGRIEALEVELLPVRHHDE